MFKFAMLAAGAIAAAASSPALAADANGRFNVRGLGSTRCDAAAVAFADKDQQRRDAMISWLMGYVSAFNRLNPGTFDALPGEDGRDLAGLALALCQYNPAVSLETAAVSGLRLLAPLQATRDGPLVSFAGPAGPNARTIRLHVEAVRVIERKLKALGRYQAAETGAASPGLTAALKAFQTAEKLSPTGLPDMPTLIRLMQAR